MKKTNLLLIIGGIFVVIGFVVPLLMTAGYIPMVLWLEMVVAVLSMLGLMMGIMGSAFIYKERKDKKDKY